MSVYKRDYAEELGKETAGSGSWVYAFRFRKIRYREAGFATKREAQLAEEVMRKKVILEGRVMKAFQAREFVSLAEETLRHRETTCSPNTVACERLKLVTLSKHFGGMDVHRITVADINRFIERRHGIGNANRTINMCLNLMRVVFKRALQYHYAAYNPMDEVKNLKEVLVDRPILSMSDFRRLLEEASKLDDTNQDAEQLVVWLKVRGFTGVRPSEAVFLEWRDIDWARNLVIVRPKVGPKAVEKNQVKDGRFRAIPIHPELKPALIKWREIWESKQAQAGRTHDWIFFHPVFPDKRALGFRRSFEEACKKAGLEGMRSYDLRHFFISEAVMAGCELMVIARWVGHGSVSMIEKVYGHLRPEYHAAQIAKIGFGPLQEKSA
jgi:integrase